MILAVGVIYGTAAVAHGSGFLAVFVAGILVGDITFEARSAVRHFNSALSDLGELAAFVALGLTIDLTMIADEGLWWRGLVVAVLLGFVIRPARRGATARADAADCRRARIHRLERAEGRRPDPARLAGRDRWD